MIVDSTVWIDYLASRATPETLFVREKSTSGWLGLTDLVLCEVLHGLPNDASFERTRLLLSTLPVLETGGTNWR